MGDPSGTRLLVAEDDRAVRDSLERALRLAGHDVVTVPDGAEALAAMERDAFDAVVLDVMMPHVDGLAVCRTLRRMEDRTPILILTARHEVTDRVAGLDAGADDYLVKPYALDELLARVRALLRRGSLVGEPDPVRVADLVLDPTTRECTRGETRLDLTKTEFDLLELFLRHPNIVLTRDVIYERVWGYEFEPGNKALEVYIGYLRRKTEVEGAPRLVHTVRGVGYALRPQ